MLWAAAFIMLVFLGLNACLTAAVVWLHGQSAPARLQCLLRARLAALGGSALPGERPAHWAPSHCLGCSS